MKIKNVLNFNLIKKQCNPNIFRKFFSSKKDIESRL